ncbi:uncharacterized protein LOC121948667 [Plectropomus leopardus]|uniref:uncharacterized protein LOC121948667 n=1 Tax=Plectropomus leopardus TaxID=160734 RepID=UPI001C4CCAEF|nr:uncharacterized protein LOC121948667 [Plectropomus leopardus]
MEESRKSGCEDQILDKDLQPGPTSDCSSEPGPEETTDLQTRSTSVLKPESASAVQSGSRPEETRIFMSGSRSDLKSGSKPEVPKKLQTGLTLNLQTGSGSNLESVSKTEQNTGLQTRSRSDLRSGSKQEVLQNLQTGLTINLETGSGSDLKPDSKPAKTKDLQTGSRSDLRSGSKPEVKNLQSGSSSDRTTGLRSDLEPEPGTSVQSGSRSKESRSKPDLQTDSRSDLKTGSKPEASKNLQSGLTLNLITGSGSDLESDSKPAKTKDLQTGSRSDKKLELRSDLQPGSGSNLKLESKPEETRNLHSGSRSDQMSGFRPELASLSKPEQSRGLQTGSYVKLESRSDLQTGSRSEETRTLKSGSRSDQMTGFRSELESVSKPERSRLLQTGSGPDLQIGSRSEESGSKPDLQTGSRSDLKTRFKTEAPKNLQSGSRSDLQPESGSSTQSESRSEESGPKLDLQTGCGSDLKSGSKPETPQNLQTGLTSNLMTGSVSDLESVSKPEHSRDLQARSDVKPESRSDLQTGSSGQEALLQSMLGKEREDSPAHQSLLTNQKLQLLSSCQRLLEKVCVCVQQGSSVSDSCEAGQTLAEAEDTLNTHLQLRAQAEAADLDAEKMKQILDQLRALQTGGTSRSSPQPPSAPSTQLSPLKALTEQLKRRSLGGHIRTSSAPPADLTDSAGLAGHVDLVLKDLQSLNRRMDLNLQLLRPYVYFLRTARQVEEELEGLREIYRRRPEEQQEEAGGSGSPLKKKQQSLGDVCWQETLQGFITCQDQGNNLLHAVTTVCAASLNLQQVELVVQQTLERLSRTKQDVNELLSQHKTKLQQQQESCRKYTEKLHKTLQDLHGVSDMLDLCTLMDLGSDQQTCRMLQCFSEARPHFTRLDAEVEFMVKSWETMRGVQEEVPGGAVKEEVKGGAVTGGAVKEEVKGGAVREEQLSELLELQRLVQKKKEQSEWILQLSSSFQLAAAQLEALLQSDPGSPLTGSTGFCGSSEAELSQQIQTLFKTASTVKTEICSALRLWWTRFRVEQLDARLLSLDSLCVSWLDEAAQRGQTLTRLLHDDIIQLRDSFKELKKRFSNLRFNYLKRNDRTRNTKAVRNQLQQVELYDDKLQALRKRLQGVTARLGSEAKDGGVAREAEDAVNELQRQMGEFERSVGEHQKNLEMTCRLQEAMEEYQFWCEDASATIARVGKFSSECRSTEAVSVLHRQFEKFVWPTVPQQEERISQITELAVRLHGAEEGRRYIEKTVSKHSEMVKSIRALSDGLKELEAKLKVESPKQKQDDREKEVKEEKDAEKEKESKENRRMKKKETDNRRTQEASDMYELKETGHTPELTAEHDGKEALVKRQTAANRKPPLQKSRSQEAAESRPQLPSSYCSTHTFSLSRSPAEANRRVRAIHGQSQPAATEATPPPSVIGPSFSDIQREFQRKESRAASNMMPLQDAPVGGLLEVDLQQQEVMTEDSLSNDEYDCVSPDDISLPPLAETPESNMVQSDFEEGFCFSSHSVHIGQHSYQSEHTGSATSAVRQQRASSQAESCPTPPINCHSSTRIRSESGSFVQSPLTVPPPSFFTSTLSSILKTGKTSSASASQTVDLSLGGPEQSFPSGNTPDGYSIKDSEKRTPPQTDPLLKEHNSQINQPQRSAGTQGKIAENVASKSETFLQPDPILQSAELNHITTLSQSTNGPQPFSGPDPPFHKDKTPPQDTESLKFNTSICQENSFPQSFPDSKSGTYQNINPFQTRTDTSPLSKPQNVSLTNTSTSTFTQQTIYFQSSSPERHYTFPQASTSHLSQSLPHIDPVHQAKGFAQNFIDSILDKDKTLDTGLLKSCTTSLQTTTTFPKDSNLSLPYPNSRSDLDQKVPSSQISKETSSLSRPQSSIFTTATAVPQQISYCQSLPSESHCTLPQATSSTLSQSKSLPKIDPVPKAKGFTQNLADSDLHNNTTLDTGFLKSYTTSLQTTTTLPQDNNPSQPNPDSRSGLEQDVPSLQISIGTSSVSRPQSSSFTTASAVNQQTDYCQSSPPESHHTLPQISSSPSSQSKTLPQIDPIHQAKGSAQNLTDYVLHKDKSLDTGLLKSCAISLQTTSTLLHDSNLSQPYPNSRSGLDQDVPFSQINKETCWGQTGPCLGPVSRPQSSSFTTATAVKQTDYCQSSSPYSSCTFPQASSNLRPQQVSPFLQGSGGLPEVNAPISLNPNVISDISISSGTVTSSNRFSSNQSHQTIYSLHKSLTSTHTQQCVYDPGMTPGSTAKPAAPPQPEPQTQALAQQANLHVTPPSSPPHLLTPDQDPNICQPVAIREEIRLTPQIQGPSLPAPLPPPHLPQAQSESLPQGKASKPGPPCFTRPLSRATVMEGSPVTLEVEVTTHPEPTLSWWVAYNQLHNNTQAS